MPISSLTPEPQIIDLLRHGATKQPDIVRGSMDDPLSELGHRQMQQALGSERWEHIVCSPLGRCRTFAEHCAKNWGVPALPDERLREYHFGDWEGRTWAELWQEQPHSVRAFFADPDNHPPPGGEIYAEFRARVLDAWDAIAADPPPRTLVITHGGVLMLVLAEVLGVKQIGGRIELGFAARARIHLCPETRRARLKFYLPEAGGNNGFDKMTK